MKTPFEFRFQTAFNIAILLMFCLYVARQSLLPARSEELKTYIDASTGISFDYPADLIVSRSFDLHRVSLEPIVNTDSELKLRVGLYVSTDQREIDFERDLENIGKKSIQVDSSMGGIRLYEYLDPASGSKIVWAFGPGSRPFAATIFTEVGKEAQDWEAAMLKLILKSFRLFSADH